MILHSVPTGRVIFEVGGVPIREEIAREGDCLGCPVPNPTEYFAALRLGAAKLPTTYEFVNRRSPPRLGNLLIEPPSPSIPLTSVTTLEQAQAS